VRGEIIGQIQGLIGKEGASTIQSMLQNTQKPNSGGSITTIFSVVTLLFGASGVFGQLQEALNIQRIARPLDTSIFPESLLRKGCKLFLVFSACAIRCNLGS
jgi:uncharacterized BrkB/YihY/UPF0761 family membrane protein